MFGLSGGVIDPAVPQVLGRIPASGPVIGVPADDRAYIATAGGTLAVGDLTIYTVLREDPLPTGSTPARELEPHGSSDLVILASDGTLHFVSGALVP